APKQGDGVGVADWRERMQSEDGKAFYRLRAEHECINAHARRMGLRQLTLRGKIKARIHLLWFAVARNMMRFLALHAKARVAA
ncbi:transposase, partial [Bradyrhizobium elkanii]|uniref:transposase n=1 Tax=Bradyrhizobium elkanii TaxID=29448 RepID=UPI00054ED1FC